MKKTLKTSSFGMSVMISLVVFLAVVVNVALSGILMYLLMHAGIVIVTDVNAIEVSRIVSVYLMFSFPVGLMLALVVFKVPLRPFRDLMVGMDRLASGDFGIRISVGRVMRHYPPFVELARGFNKMAEQLENTEMLRSDFINNFSHEFKTPIVSILGFAKLIRRDDMPLEQKKEYLAIIEEESLRLSDMATNVLNLTKVENQTILTDVTTYNLSEQLRSCLLLLESKWEFRDLDFQLDFGEYTIQANEELLKQVWINLLDNAIKFTPDGHSIQLAIRETDTKLEVDVTNTGTQIAPEQQSKIFNKFYQADESHSAIGNGVGLAIVRQIARLHGGNVRVKSENMVTTFTVELPRGK